MAEKFLLAYLYTDRQGLSPREIETKVTTKVGKKRTKVSTVYETIFIDSLSDYPVLVKMQGWIRKASNGIFLANANVTKQECLTAAVASLLRRSEEWFETPVEKRTEFVKRVTRSATFKVIRRSIERQGPADPDNPDAFSEPIEPEGKLHRRVGGILIPTEYLDWQECNREEDRLIAQIDAKLSPSPPEPSEPSEYDHMAITLGKADADWLWSYQADTDPDKGASAQRSDARKPKTPAERKRASRLRSRLYGNVTTNA
jgi:hypothetical protein